MSNDDKLKATLISQKNELNSSAGFYGCLIQNSLMSSSVQRIEEMRGHQQWILDQAKHQEFKAESSKCLSCPNVLSCSKQC